MALAREVDAVGASQKLVAAGFAPLPILTDGSKAPTGPGWKGGYKLVGPKMFDGNHVAVACGSPSRHLLVIDFDVPDKHWRTDPGPWACPAFDPWREAVAEERGRELFESLGVVKTPSGGRHVYFRVDVPDEAAWAKALGKYGHNQKLARIEVADPATGALEKRVVVETRALGGYVAAPPTPGYEWLQGSPESVPTLSVDQALSLIGIARRFNKVDDEPEQPKPAQRMDPGDELRPGDDYNLRGKSHFEDCLRSNGWTHFQGELWRHPKAAKGHTKSAEFHHVDDGKWGFRCYSDNVGWMDANQTLSLFAAYFKLMHGGDAAAAAKALAGEGFGSSKAGHNGKARIEDVDALTTAEGEPVPPTIEELAKRCYPTGDTFNRDILLELHGHEMLYLTDLKTWAVWKGGVWVVDPEGPRRKAEDVAEVRQQQAETIPGDDDHKEMKDALKRSVRGCRSRAGIDNMVSLAKAPEQMRAESKDFDTSKHELCCLNGVVDVRTGQLRPHRSSDRFMRQVPHAYNPNAGCPTFDKFIREFSKERETLRRALMLFLGYSLTGFTYEEKWLMLYGKRNRNGKTKLQNVMMNVLGPDFCGFIDKHLFRLNPFNSAKFSLASIVGKRLVLAEEAGGDRKIDAEFVKHFVGGSETLQIERKGIDQETVPMSAKLIFTVNKLPPVDFDSGFYDRLIIFSCDQCFYTPDHPKYQPGDLMPDGRLDEKLKAESEGILAEMVRWSGIWHENGLEIPQESREVLNSYESANDHMGEWIEECCQESDSFKEGVGRLHKSYLSWAKENNRPSLSSQAFRHGLDQRGFEVNRPGNVRTAKGIRLLATDQGTLEEEDPYAAA